MKVRDAMTTNLITLSVSSSCQEAAKLMKQFNIGTVLCLENNNLVGLITDRDLVLRLVAENKRPSDCLLKDFMTQSPISISPDTSLDQAAEIMAENQIRRLPCIQDSKLVGILTLGDLAVQSPNNANKVLLHVSKPIRRDIAA